MRGVEEAVAQAQIPAGERGVAEAALRGTDALAALLSGAQPVRRIGSQAPRTPVGPVWLKRLRVEGFQGIGQPLDLELQGQPGLTVFIGRNGSGKSSLAEALQIAITGTSSRWEGKNKAWRESWRNLHHASEPAVDAEFAVEGSSHRLRVEARWSGSSETPKVKHSHGSKPLSEAELGWREVLDVYRPFLAYSELSSLLGGKSTEAHDALMRGLNLTALDEAIKSLRAEAARRSKVLTASQKAVGDLRGKLQHHDDPRVARCLAALSSKTPQLDTLEDVLSGTDPRAEASLEVLRQAIRLNPLDLARIQRAASALETAAQAYAKTSLTESGRDLEIADLLTRALSLHQNHGADLCPVCGQGALNDAWRSEATVQAKQLRERAGLASAAAQRLHDTRREFERSLPSGLPNVVGLDSHGLDVAGALQGLEAVVNVRNINDDLVRAAAALERAAIADEAFARLRSEAADKLAAQEDVWRELHPIVSSWYQQARQAEEVYRWYQPVKGAQKALEKILDQLREERWAPVAGTVRALWDTLRISSNVQLGELRLTGSGSNRHIEYDLSVDDTPNAAIGVMSQGELTALALSLFLPRVTLPESPFKFLILDDPVQSMDMARVDGLARVLSELAEERQIIVFTHDERLREALLRLQIPVTIQRVSRAPNSVVSVRKSSSPADLYLSDADSLAGDAIPAELARVSVPLLGRLAIEATCVQIIRGRILEAGGTLQEAEDLLQELPRTIDQVAYVQFNENGRNAELYTTMNSAIGPWSVDALRSCAEGAHGKFDGDVRLLVKDVRRLCRALR